MAERSEHFLNCLATIAAVNVQLLQSNLVIMRGNANYLPSASDADKRYQLDHQAPVTGCRCRFRQEVEQAGCCLKVTPSPYATKLFTLTQYE